MGTLSGRKITILSFKRRAGKNTATFNLRPVSPNYGGRGLSVPSMKKARLPLISAGHY